MNGLGDDDGDGDGDDEDDQGHNRMDALHIQLSNTTHIPKVFGRFSNRGLVCLAGAACVW